MLAVLMMARTKSRKMPTGVCRGSCVGLFNDRGDEGKAFSRGKNVGERRERAVTQGEFLFLLGSESESDIRNLGADGRGEKEPQT